MQAISTANASLFPVDAYSVSVPYLKSIRRGIHSKNNLQLPKPELIQNKLEELLKTVILPHQKFEIEHQWSGTMGVGIHKKPIVTQLSNHVYCGVRMGGMGVAIGSLVGQELAELV